MSKFVAIYETPGSADAATDDSDPAVAAEGMTHSLGALLVMQDARRTSQPEGIPPDAVDALTPEQLGQLQGIADALLKQLDPDAAMAALYRRHDPAP